MAFHSGKIVVLNAFPGTGKLTILRKAQGLLPTGQTCLFDNHLLIDPVVAIIPERNQAHHELRHEIRRSIFRQLRNRAQEGYIILMTACLVRDNETDGKFLQEHLDMVRGTNVPIFWINAHCDEETLMQRVRSPERCRGNKSKLTDPLILLNLLRTYCLVEPSKNASESIELVVGNLDANGPVDLSVTRLMEMIGFPRCVISA